MLWFHSIDEYKRQEKQCRVKPETVEYFQETFNLLAHRSGINPATIRSVHMIGVSTYLVRFYVDRTLSDLTACSILVDLGKHQVQQFDAPIEYIDSLNLALNKD